MILLSHPVVGVAPYSSPNSVGLSEGHKCYYSSRSVYFTYNKINLFYAFHRNRFVLDPYCIV